MEVIDKDLGAILQLAFKEKALQTRRTDLQKQ